MKVYVATEGSYSDYRILGVFSRRGDAEAVGEVEEYDVWDQIPAKRAVHIIMARGPEYVAKTEVRVLQPWDYSWQWFGTTKRPKVEVDHNRVLRISGTDQQLVEKAYQDRRAQLIAEAEGVAV